MPEESPFFLSELIDQTAEKKNVRFVPSSSSPSSVSDVASEPDFLRRGHFLIMRTGPHGLEEQRLENRRRVGLYSLGPRRKKNRTRIHVKSSIMSDTHPDHDLCLSSQQHPGPTWPAPRMMWSKADCTPVDGRQNISNPRPPRFRTRSPGPESQSSFLLYNHPLLRKLLRTEFMASLQRRTPNINDSSVEYTS